jgi:hypothetical protein
LAWKTEASLEADSFTRQKSILSDMGMDLHLRQPCDILIFFLASIITAKDFGTIRLSKLSWGLLIKVWSPHC